MKLSDKQKDEIMDWIADKVEHFGEVGGCYYFKLDQRFELMLEVPDGYPDGFDADEYENPPVYLSLRVLQNQYFEYDNPLPYQEGGECADDYFVGEIGEKVEKSQIEPYLESALDDYEFFTQDNFKNLAKDIVAKWQDMGVLPQDFID